MTSEGPEHGARFEIAREHVDGAAADFGVRVVEAHSTHEARVTISASTIDARWVAPPPRWIADTALGFFKTLQKNHASDGSWPTRLVRWRAEKV